MSMLTDRLPDHYRDCPPVAELERVLGLESGSLSQAEADTLAQLWVDTATWGLDLWETWCGLPVDRTGLYSARRGRIKAKLRGQGTTTADSIADVVASFGFQPEQISVLEHFGENRFEVVLSDLAVVPEDLSGPTAAVNEIKPAHLAWYFTFELAALTAQLRAGGAFWTVRETALPPMEV